MRCYNEAKNPLSPTSLWWISLLHHICDLHWGFGLDVGSSQNALFFLFHITKIEVAK